MKAIKERQFKKKQQIIDDSAQLSLYDFEKKHSSVMFFRYGNEELQAYVMECREAYAQAIEVVKAKEVQKPKGQRANAEEAVHMLGVKQSEIRAIEEYIEQMKDDFKNVDMSKVKKGQTYNEHSFRNNI